MFHVTGPFECYSMGPVQVTGSRAYYSDLCILQNPEHDICSVSLQGSEHVILNPDHVRGSWPGHNPQKVPSIMAIRIAFLLPLTAGGTGLLSYRFFPPVVT